MSATNNDSGLNLDHLEALARAATPGEWTAKPQGRVIGGPMRHYVNGSAQAQIASFNVTYHEQAPDDEPDRQQANAEFCAAANPAAVLELIALARRAAPVSAPIAGDAAMADRIGAENYRSMLRVAERMGYASISCAIKSAPLRPVLEGVKDYSIHVDSRAALANQPAPAAAPEQVAPTEAFAWAVFAENGNVIIWSKNRAQVEPAAKQYGRPVVPVIALSVKSQPSEAAPLAEALALLRTARDDCGLGSEIGGKVDALLARVAAHQPAQEQASTDQIVKVLMYLDANGALAWRGTGDDEADAADEAGALAHSAQQVAKAMAAIRAQEHAEPVARHPVQPLVVDDHGRTRFKKNAIVKHLAEGKLNDLAVAFPSEDHTEDWEQLAQLIGYSLDGFGTLSYVTDETYQRAATQQIAASPVVRAQSEESEASK